MDKAVTTLRTFVTRVAEWAKRQLRIVRIGAKRGNPLFVGIGSTKLFLAGIAVLAFLPQQTSEGWSWRLWSFLMAPSNEIGDTLAGIAGALAFLWIIVTVMLQSKELRAQREELRLTRKEFGRMALAQEEQKTLNKAQFDALELRSKQQLRDQEFEELLQSVRSGFLGFEANWKFVKPSKSHGYSSEIVEIDFAEDPLMTDAKFFQELSYKLYFLLFDLEHEEESGTLEEAPSKLLDFPSQITPAINRLCEMKTELSPSKLTKFKYLGIDSIRQSLAGLDDDKWWNTKDFPDAPTD